MIEVSAVIQGKCFSWNVERKLTFKTCDTQLLAEMKLQQTAPLKELNVLDMFICITIFIAL